MTIRWKPNGSNGPKTSVDPLTQGQKEIQDNQDKLWTWPNKYLRLQSSPYNHSDQLKQSLKQTTNSGAKEDKFVLSKNQGCQILLAGPHLIKKWAQKQPDYYSGPIQKFRSNQVLCPDTFDYKTFKPYTKGLFCQTLFGKMYQKRTLLERRHSLAYCQLRTPVMHIWYLKGTVSHLSRLLKIKRGFLERLIYMKAVTITSSYGFLGTNGANVRHLIKRPQSTIFQKVSQLKSKEHPYIGYHFSNTWLKEQNKNSLNSCLINYLQKNQHEFHSQSWSQDKFIADMQYEGKHWYCNNLYQGFNGQQKNINKVILRSPNFVQNQIDESNDHKQLDLWKPILIGEFVWQDGYQVIAEGSHEDASFSNYVVHDYERGGLYTKPYSIESSDTIMTYNKVYGLINVNTAWTDFYAQRQCTSYLVPQVNTKLWDQWVMYVFFLSVHQSETLAKVVKEISYVESAVGLYYPKHKPLVSSRILDSAINLFYGNRSQSAKKALELRHSVYSQPKNNVRSKSCFASIYGPQPQLHEALATAYNKKTIVWSWHTQYSDGDHVDRYYDFWYQRQYTLQERHFSRKVSYFSTNNIRYELGSMSRCIATLLKNPFKEAPWSTVRRKKPVKKDYETFDNTQEVSDSLCFVEPLDTFLFHTDLPSDLQYKKLFVRQKFEQYKGEKYYTYHLHSRDDLEEISPWPTNRFILSYEKSIYGQIDKLARDYERIDAFQNYNRLNLWPRGSKQKFGEKQCWQSQLLWYTFVLVQSPEKTPLTIEAILKGRFGEAKVKSKPILIQDPRLIKQGLQEIKPDLIKGLEPEEQDHLKKHLNKLVHKAAQKVSSQIPQDYMLQSAYNTSIWECTTFWNFDFWCSLWLHNQRHFASLKETNSVSWMSHWSLSKIQFRKQKLKKYQSLLPESIAELEKSVYRLDEIKTFWDIRSDIKWFMHYCNTLPHCDSYAKYLTLLPETTLNPDLSSNLFPYILPIWFETTRILDQIPTLFYKLDLMREYLGVQKDAWNKAIYKREKIKRAIQSKHRTPNPDDTPMFLTLPFFPMCSQRKKVDSKLSFNWTLRAKSFTLDSGQDATLAMLKNTTNDIYSCLVNNVSNNKKQVNNVKHLSKQNDLLYKLSIESNIKIGFKSDTLAISWVKLNNLEVNRISYTKLFKMIRRLVILKQTLIDLQKSPSLALTKGLTDKDMKLKMVRTALKKQIPQNTTTQNFAHSEKKLRLSSSTISLNLDQILQLKNESNFPLIKWFMFKLASRKVASFVTKLACSFLKNSVAIKYSRVKPGLRMGVQKSILSANPNPVPCQCHSVIKWTVYAMLQKQSLVYQIKQHSKALTFNYWNLTGFGVKTARAFTSKHHQTFYHEIIDVFLNRFYGGLNSTQTWMPNSDTNSFSSFNLKPYMRQSSLKTRSSQRWNRALLWYYDTSINPFVLQPCPIGVLNSQYVGYCDLPIHIEPLISVSEVTLPQRHVNAIKPETICHLWTSATNRSWSQVNDMYTCQKSIVPERMSQTQYYRHHKSIFLEQFKGFLERYPEFIRNKSGVWYQLTLLKNTKVLNSGVLDDFITRPCNLISTASKGYAERSFSPVLPDIGPQSIVLQLGRLNQPDYGYDSLSAIPGQGPYKRYRDQLQRQVNHCNMILKSSTVTLDQLAIGMDSYRSSSVDSELSQLYLDLRANALAKNANTPRNYELLSMPLMILNFTLALLVTQCDSDVEFDNVDDVNQANQDIYPYIVAKHKGNSVNISPTKWYESMPGQLTRQGYQKSWGALTYNNNIHLAYHDQDTWDDSQITSAACYSYQPNKSSIKPKHILKKKLHVAQWSDRDYSFLDGSGITGFRPPKYTRSFFNTVKTVLHSPKLPTDFDSKKGKQVFQCHSLKVKSALINVGLSLSTKGYGSLKQKTMQKQVSTSHTSIVKTEDIKDFVSWADKVSQANSVTEFLVQKLSQDWSHATMLLEQLAQQRVYPVGFRMDSKTLKRSYQLCWYLHSQKASSEKLGSIQFTNPYLENIEVDLQLCSKDIYLKTIRDTLKFYGKLSHMDAKMAPEHIRWEQPEEALLAMESWARLGQWRRTWVLKALGYSEQGLSLVRGQCAVKKNALSSSNQDQKDEVDVKSFDSQVNLNVNVVAPGNLWNQTTVVQPHFKYQTCNLPTLRLGQWPKRNFLAKYFAFLNAKALYRLGPTELPDIYFQVMVKVKRKLAQLFTKRAIACRQLRMVENFDHDQVEPSWLFMTRFPILPPDLRPMIVEPYGQTISSDLNKLYAQVIEKSILMHNVFEDKATAYDWDRDPWLGGAMGIAVSKDWSYNRRVTVYDPRQKEFYKYPNITDRLDTVTGLTWLQTLTQVKLQYCMDQLIQNGRGARPALTGLTNPRPLKSLSDILKGKKGRFRNNLLGKRVDYSGRSVIVVGPKLQLHQCGLPWEMAIVLFEPFIIRELRYRKVFEKFKIHKVKRLIKARAPIIVRLLKQLLQCRPVLLNRAPTLHRLGVQAFQGQLISGRAILLHPLVCGGFNADFDGDQMAVHIPLGNLACAESWSLMWSQNHILSVATGDVVPIPSQDMVLGIYHLTTTDINGRFMMLMNYILRQPRTEMSAYLWDSQTFTSVSHINTVYHTCVVPKQTIVWLQCPVFECESKVQETLELSIDVYGHAMEYHPEYKTYTYQYQSSYYVKTTIGKAILNSHLDTILRTS